MSDGVHLAHGTRRWNHYDAGLLLWGGKERCGFVVEDRGSAAGFCFIELPNVSSDPEHFFEMPPEEVKDIYSRFTVVGVWHSHPPGHPQPSATDVEWHTPAFGDMYIVCDVAIKRYHLINDSLMYQEVSTPWNTV